MTALTKQDQTCLPDEFRVQESPPLEPVLLTLPQAAKRLGQAEDTLRTWRLAGKGPIAIRVGRRVMYPVSELDAYVANLIAEAKAQRTAVA